MINVPKEVEKSFFRHSSSIIAVVDGKVNAQEFIPTKIICSCNKGIHEIQDIKIIDGNVWNQKCKYCGCNLSYRSSTFSTEKVYEQEKSTGRFWHNQYKPSTEHKNDTTIYFRKHPTKNGIECYIGSVIYTLDESDEKNIKMNESLDIKYYASIVSGEPVYAIKVLKRSNKEVDLFEAFNINSQTRYGKTCIFEDANNVVDFMDKNRSFFEKTGIFELLKNGESHRIQNLEGFLIVFIALNAKYPVLELLVKMGYTKMYFDIFTEVVSAGNKVAIQDVVIGMNKLLSESTKGSLALRIPQYIGTYLRNKYSNLQEYLSWCDIYEMENISKENFERLINSMQYYMCLNSGSLDKIADILKYGYSFNELLKYLYKIQRNHVHDKCNYYNRYYYDGNDMHYYKENVDMLRDYLQMCDLLNIEPDKTPKDLKKVHDELTVAYKAKQNEHNDAKFKALADSIMEYTKRDKDAKLTKMEEKYEIVIPSSTYELIKEGQQQHNCVGSYCRSILNGDCIIFFVRKRNNPDESYITGEYRNGHLGQLMYKNNIRVIDKEIINYCNVFCNKIQRGIKSGRIKKCA